MKKTLLFVLLVLCTIFSSSVLADNISICSTLQNTTDDRIMTDDYEYTHAIALDGFTLYIPSDFIEMTPSRYATENASIGWFTEFYRNTEGDAYYKDAQEWYQHWLTEFENAGQNRQVRWADECVALIEIRQSDGKILFVPAQIDTHTTIYIEISNREHWLVIGIEAVTDELTTVLANGLLDHIVAKEIPLEELDQTE